MLGSSWQLLARFWGLWDAQSRPKCTKNAKLLIVKTLNNFMFLEGFEGWRHPSSWLQNELLETLEAGLGADEVIQRS